MTIDLKTKLLKIVVCNQTRDVKVKKALDFAIFCNKYGDDRVRKHGNDIVIDGPLTQMTISYKTLHSHNYDGLCVDEFELHSSAAMNGSMKDIIRVLEALRLDSLARN